VRHVRLAALLLTVMLICSGSLFADSVQMTFLGPGTNNSGGVYTFPYNFSINGGAPVQLLCDAFDNDVYTGETWTASVTNLLSGQGLFGSNDVKYKAAGLIFNGILGGSIDASTGNWAIWGLFSPTAQSQLSLSALILQGIYLGIAASTPNNSSWFDGIVIYTPTQWTGSKPQEFIGKVSVPEPGQVALILLLGIATASAFAFRNRLGLKLAIQQS
jgi:hypothetical protein